jgi:hypothetical protein
LPKKAVTQDEPSRRKSNRLSVFAAAFSIASQTRLNAAGGQEYAASKSTLEPCIAALHEFRSFALVI